MWTAPACPHGAAVPLNAPFTPGICHRIRVLLRSHEFPDGQNPHQPEAPARNVPRWRFGLVGVLSVRKLVAPKKNADSVADSWRKWGIEWYGCSVRTRRSGPHPSPERLTPMKLSRLSHWFSSV